MIDLMEKYTMEELASLYAHMNVYEWPTEILGSEPWYWENARKTNSIKLCECKRFMKLFKKLEKNVPEEFKSHAWWIEILGRTEEEWWNWWYNIGQWVDPLIFNE